MAMWKIAITRLLRVGPGCSASAEGPAGGGVWSMAIVRQACSLQ
jgi:hypothetical protein